jgi:hypothetical protein
MRHVVYLLVVVNLVFLGWNIFQNQSVRQVDRSITPLPETAVPLVTLQEREKERRAAGEVSAIEHVTGNEPPGAGASMVCQTLGPFLVREAMQEMEAKLATMGLEPQLRETERQRPIGYWVHLPDMERAEARRQAQILDDHNDKEYYLGKDNVLSLGAFQDINRAKKRLKRVHKLGLDAQLETRYRTIAEYWLDFQLESAAGEQLTALEADDPDVWLQDRACY